MFNNNSQNDDYVLDFEYSKFHTEPSLEILASMAARFAMGCSQYLPKQSIDSWFNEMVEAVDVRNAEAKQLLKERFNYFLNNKLSRKKRRKIGAGFTTTALSNLRNQI